MALAATNHWFLHQLDVNNTSYMVIYWRRLTWRYPILYGLKQASRQWNAKLTTAITSLGFHQSTFDHSMFIKSQHASIAILLVYVGDIMLTGNCMTKINYIILFLDQQIKIKDLEDLKFFLGLEVARSKSRISLS